MLGNKPLNQIGFVPGVKRDDWPLDDPKGRTLDEVRRIRDEIRQRVERLIAIEDVAQT